jgi:hypothetical protein
MATKIALPVISLQTQCFSFVKLATHGMTQEKYVVVAIPILFVLCLTLTKVEKYILLKMWAETIP